MRARTEEEKKKHKEEEEEEEEGEQEDDDDNNEGEKQNEGGEESPRRGRRRRNMRKKRKREKRWRRERKSRKRDVVPVPVIGVGSLASRRRFLGDGTAPISPPGLEVGLVHYTAILPANGSLVDNAAISPCMLPRVGPSQYRGLRQTTGKIDCKTSHREQGK